MALYNRYCVNKCTAEIEFTLMNNITDVSDICFAYFSLDDTAFAPADASTAVEMSMACGGKTRTIGKSGTVPSSTKMYLACDVAKLLSARKNEKPVRLATRPTQTPKSTYISVSRTTMLE